MAWLPSLKTYYLKSYQNITSWYYTMFVVFYKILIIIHYNNEERGNNILYFVEWV